MENITLTKKPAMEDATHLEVSYGVLLEKYSIKYTQDNHYLICGRGQQHGDRRLYISIVISQVEDLLRLLIPELVSMGLGFGMVKDQQSARLVLNGYLGAEHVGKVLIIFMPRGREDMVQKIAGMTQCFFGPVVPGKVQISSCVFVDHGHDGHVLISGSVFSDLDVAGKVQIGQNDDKVILDSEQHDDLLFIDQEITGKAHNSKNDDRVTYDQVSTGAKTHMQNNIRNNNDVFSNDQEITGKEQIVQNDNSVIYDQVPTGSKIKRQDDIRNSNSVFDDQAVTRQNKIKRKDFNGQSSSRQKKNGSRIQVLNGKYIVISVLKSDPKGDVLKALYLNRFLLPIWCIIKEGRKFMVSDDAGRDMDDRLNWQADLHETLQAVINIPRVIGLFQQDGNTYLAMERIRGKNIGKVIDEVYGRKVEKAMPERNSNEQVRIQTTANGLMVDPSQNPAKQTTSQTIKTWLTLTRKKQLYLLSLLLRAIDMIARVHALDYLHRDISTANFLVTPRGKLYLIDWELAFDLKEQYPLPPFGFGTPGFISPEQNLGEYPTVKEDIHGLAALMLVFFTGIRPVGLKGEDREDVGGFLFKGTGEEGISDLVGRGMDRDRNNRPELGELREAVVALMEARR